MAEDKVIQFPEIKAEELSLEDLINDADLDEDNKKVILGLFSALELPEQEFAFLSEVLLQDFERRLNNPNDKIALVQALNADGLHAEDVLGVFAELQDEVENVMKGRYSGQKIAFMQRLIGLITNAITETEGIAKRMISVPIQLIHEDAKIPQYARAGDAGMDVYAIEDITIRPGETKIVPTGLKCAVPLGYELQVRPRSGLSVKTPLRVANAPGTIDSGYRGEIGVIITNTNPVVKEIKFDPETGKVNDFIYGEDYTITKGMRFAQLVLSEVPTCVFYEVDNVDEIGEDRKSGFGETGNN